VAFLRSPKIDAANNAVAATKMAVILKKPQTLSEVEGMPALLHPASKLKGGRWPP
jgi:hypothetical protein